MIMDLLASVKGWSTVRSTRICTLCIALTSPVAYIQNLSLIRCKFEMGRSPSENSEEIATYCGIFLFKHICPVEHCGGTMCPKNGWHSGQEVVYDCNVCTRERTETEFMTELEEMDDDEYDIDSDEPEEEDYPYDDTKDASMDTD